MAPQATAVFLATIASVSACVAGALGSAAADTLSPLPLAKMPPMQSVAATSSTAPAILTAATAAPFRGSVSRITPAAAGSAREEAGRAGKPAFAAFDSSVGETVRIGLHSNGFGGARSWRSLLWRERNGLRTAPRLARVPVVSGIMHFEAFCAMDMGNGPMPDGAGLKLTFSR